MRTNQLLLPSFLLLHVEFRTTLVRSKAEKSPRSFQLESFAASIYVRSLAHRGWGRERERQSNTRSLLSYTSSSEANTRPTSTKPQRKGRNISKRACLNKVSVWERIWPTSFSYRSSSYMFVSNPLIILMEKVLLFGHEASKARKRDKMDNPEAKVIYPMKVKES